MFEGNHRRQGKWSQGIRPIRTHQRQHRGNQGPIHSGATAFRKYVDDYIDLADGAKQHFELPRTAREYKPSDFSPKFPISNVKFEVDESVKDFIHVLPRGLFFYQNEFYDAVFGDKTDYPE